MRNILILAMMFVCSAGMWGELKLISPYPFQIGEELVFNVQAIGVYLGDQKITINREKVYRGQRVIEGYGSIKSTAMVSRIYNLNDKEKTYFNPITLKPVYNEKWIKEGEWQDRMFYSFTNGLIEYTHQKGGNRKKTIKTTGWVENYFTLILKLRCIDYDYYIRSKKTVSIDYLYGEKIAKARFRVVEKTIRVHGKDARAYYLTGEGGIKFSAVILKNANRVPLQLVMPSVPTDKRSVSFHIKLKSFKRGKKQI